MTVVFVTTAPLYAQRSGVPPFSNETAPSPSVLPPSADEFSSIEPSRPIEAEVYPYKDRPLRDPFWTVGYFPQAWGQDLQPNKRVNSVSEWRIPTSQIKVSGVSRMGRRVMAIINGELKQVGEVIEISYLGKFFQWKIIEIQSDGNVRFERYQIVNDTPR